MSNIIRRYVDHMEFVPYMGVWFIVFFRVPMATYFILVYMVVYFVMFLFNFVDNVFVL